jgi:hypothetical protein
MSAHPVKIHFNVAPPAYSPPPAYAAHSFGDNMMSFAQKERIASVAEAKLGYLVTQKRREPSLRQVLLHASFLERVLDSIEATTPESFEDEPIIDESYEQVEMMVSPVVAEEQSYQTLPTIAEVDEMEVDEEDEDEDDMPPLERTPSHRPVSPVSDDDDFSDDSDDELPSPPPQYTAGPDHPLFNLFEVREKARRDDLSHHYRIEHNDPSHMFLMNDGLVVAA